ncbi:MAG: right-handed parallel beta-helix repeat-containing protein, partial [candidate division KSB1 bacterium]|nr:right-handed parallel beta-helix repeat-containing protein [candidate division KSB1 bacterium]
EWYLDRREGKLYYLPLPDEEISSTQVIAPDLDQLVIFQGEPLFGRYVHHIRLQGVTLSHNDWFLPPGDPGDHFGADTVPGALKIVGGRDLTIENCRFEHLGTYAVEVRDGSRRITFRRNVIDDIGAGGFLITGGRAGSDSLLVTDRLQILDNSLSRLGRLYFAGIGILSMHASNNRIAHNEISDLYYTGISVGLEWGYKPSAAFGNVVEYNLIERAGQGVLSDMGGIYTLGVSPGTIIRNNIVHDIETWGYGGWGIYTDEGSSGILIEKNIVYNTKSGGFHQHYGHDNIIRNNIFAFGRTAQLMRSRNETHRSFTFERNILYWKDGELLDKHWRGDTTHFLFRNNLYFRTDGKPVRFAKLSAEKWQKKGQDRGSLFADPKFVDPLKGDFNLQPDSPAFLIGFEPIDMTKVGPRSLPDGVKKRVYAEVDDNPFTASFYKANASEPRPMLLWLGGGDDEVREAAAVSLVRWCTLKNWVFVSPELTAICSLPEARQLSVLMKAVNFALANASVDTARIYLFGYREGANLALQMADKTPQLLAAVSAWEPNLKSGALEDFFSNRNNRSAAGENPVAVEIVQRVEYEAGRDPVEAIFDLYEKPAIEGESNAFSIKAFLSELKSGIGNNRIKDPYFAENCVLFRKQDGQLRLTFYSGKDDILPNAALHWLESQKKGQ